MYTQRIRIAVLSSALGRFTPAWELLANVFIKKLTTLTYNVLYFCICALNIKQKWQIGAVFIPDSVGYFISTNFFAIIAHKFGQVRTAVLSLAIVGISCLLVRNTNVEFFKLKCSVVYYRKIILDSTSELSCISAVASFFPWHWYRYIRCGTSTAAGIDCRFKIRQWWRCFIR